MPHAAVRRGLVAALALLAAGLGTLTPRAEASEFRPGPVGSDDFAEAATYSGDFPDPSVVKVGAKYYGYSTTIANQNLPIITSTDMRTWTALPTRPDGGHPDGLPIVAKWASWQAIGSRRVAPTWAPSVAYMDGKWVHAYATQLKNKSRFCISLSSSSRPDGVFVDSSTRALVCPTREGAIDPYLWRSPQGAFFLLFKTEGIASAGVPSRLFIQRLNNHATGLYPGSRAVELLRTAPDSWEGRVVENPAMFRMGNRYYLFYSGNDWSSSAYAIGYAICETAYGPCKRPVSTPLIKTNKYVAGPGGASPFVDANGLVRLAYHAWTPGQVGYPKNDDCMDTKAGCAQRRLHIARLVTNSKGLIRVAQSTMQSTMSTSVSGRQTARVQQGSQ